MPSVILMDYLESHLTKSLGKGVSYPITTYVSDKKYLSFIENVGGGLFFDKSLLIYSLDKKEGFSSFFSVNSLVNEMYSQYVGGLTVFGCDIFGNQFGFHEKGVVFLNIETATFEVVAKSFEYWLEELQNDSNFYTGQSILTDWEAFHGRKLLDPERLCPKIPFVAGGAYEASNLYAMPFSKTIDFNFNIATQVFNLPDGSAIKFNTID